ncbi:fumarylacetoacetate hydrolase family protein [Kocuria sp. NPDC057446]|uniref:fumarylacetoacetate hydrolase family protein n=1 Tax=Kocuria sp. NPDC057446 TaxID=3346137 RepID=UPI00368E4C07
MRWVTYRSAADPTPRAGLLVGDTVRAPSADASLRDLLAEGQISLSAAAREACGHPHEVLPLAQVQVLAPIPDPPSVRDFMAFEEHVVTSMGALGTSVDPVWYEQPVFYFTNPAAVVGPTQDVAVSPGSTEFDYELEIAAVIGRPGSNLTVEQAEEHIAGYTILCDWSARDLQAAEMRVGLGPAKGKDTATSLGPYLITPDELASYRAGNGYDLSMSVRVNGTTYSTGNWADLYWSFPQMISYASRGTTLRTGDVIGSGTVGTGCILELSRVHGTGAYPWLRPGDQVEVAVEALGTLHSTIRPPVVLHPLGPALTTTPTQGDRS